MAEQQKIVWWCLEPAPPARMNAKAARKFGGNLGMGIGRRDLDRLTICCLITPIVGREVADNGLTMKTLELWRWAHTDTTTGKRLKTRYLLSEAEALERLVDPVRIDHSHEVRQVPDGPHEWHMTGAFRNAPRKPSTTDKEKNRPPGEG